jgi:serine-type D-Ala-D-Ala carboxypeptidase (penicillin-binding protein 5/6)
MLTGNIPAQLKPSMDSPLRALVSLIFLYCIASISWAQPIIPAAPDLAAKSWILIDANTGKILTEHDSELQLPPASLTKLMTAYLAFEEIGSGRLGLQEEVLVSENAWIKGGTKSGGSTMFLPPNEPATVEDLLRGVIIQSGNDASIALAEHIAGSEEAFADLMTQNAQRMGLSGTNYWNATGLPADGHLTTAKDLASLAQAIIRDHPDHYSIYSEKEFEYNGINQPNRNQLLWRDASVDGLKTGHTEEAGYCLVASAERNGMRLISVVMGTSSEAVRTTESQKILTWGFRYFSTHHLYSASDNLAEAQVWEGKTKLLSLGVAEDIQLTIPRGDEAALTAEILIADDLRAPISRGQEVGLIKVLYRGDVVHETALVAQQDVEQAGFFGRLWDRIKLFFMNIFGKA